MSEGCEAVITRYALIILILMLPGCASRMQSITAGSAGRQAQEAGRLMRAGDYTEARTAWQRIAKERSGAPAGEQAAYEAVLVLVHPRNPAKDYRQASGEFEAFLRTYPSGAHAGDAEAWLGVLGMLDQARVTALLEEAGALAKKLEQADSGRKKAEAERDGLARERAALAGERDELKKRIDAMIEERGEMLKEQTALLRARDGLAKDKAALGKKAEGLARDKERLLAAKAKLEKRLRELTDVDIKMEKRRKAH